MAPVEQGASFLPDVLRSGALTLRRLSIRNSGMPTSPAVSTMLKAADMVRLWSLPAKQLRARAGSVLGAHPQQQAPPVLVRQPHQECAARRRVSVHVQEAPTRPRCGAHSSSMNRTWPR